MVHAAQGSVVDDALGAGDKGREASEAVHGGAGFAAGARDPVDVEDDASVRVGGTGGDEDELGAPGDFAVAFDVKAHRRDRARKERISPVRRSTRSSVGSARNSGVTTLPSAWSIRERSGWVQEPAPSGSRSPSSRACRAASSREAGERSEHVGVSQVPVPRIEIVVATHRRRRQPPGRISREPSPDAVADQTPDRGVGELGFDLAGTAVDADQRFVDQPQVLGILAASTPTIGIRAGDQLGELVDRRVVNDRRRPAPALQPQPSVYPPGSASSAVQSQPIRRAAPSRLRVPKANATASIRPVAHRTCRPAHAASDPGRTYGSAGETGASQGLAHRLGRMRPATLGVLRVSMVEQVVGFRVGAPEVTFELRGTPRRQRPQRASVLLEP